MKIKSEETIFVCQVAEGLLKAAKCVGSQYSKREFSGLEVEKIPFDMDDSGVAEKIKQLFKKIGYNNNPIVISIPRHQATCRYLKIPSINSQEIERIISLQAARYLPYPAVELVTGYQLIQTDKEGYSHINLLIAHKHVIERCIRLFKEFKAEKQVIVLSSYGLCNLYNYIHPQFEPNPVIIVDIDSQLVELVIIYGKKVLFSRSFGLSRAQANWGNIFMDEIKKTCNAYLKEVISEPVGKIIILNTGQALKGFEEVIAAKAFLPVEILSCTDKLKFTNKLPDDIINSENSFFSVLGLGLEVVEDSLNLLPMELKSRIRNNSSKKEQSKITLLILGIVLIFILGIVKSFDNKTRYLALLKEELTRVVKEAKPVEDMDKTLRFMDVNGRQTLSALRILYELHRIIPGQVYLTNFSYEGNNQVILHGQAPELEEVFVFVSELQKSSEFKGFDIRVKYASQKKAQSNEVIDFEIICVKR